MKDIFNTPDLKANERLLLLYLHKYPHAKKNSNEELAKAINLSNKNTVNNLIYSLELKGYLKKIYIDTKRILLTRLDDKL